MNRLSVFFAALAAFFVFALPQAHAQTRSSSEYTASERAYFVPYAGYFDARAKDDTATQLGLEYRWASRYWNLRPAVGANITLDGAFYGYGAVFWDMDLWGSGLFLTPNFAAGFYESGSGKNLGGTVQFRSGVELSYDLYDGHRVGVAFNHISNADIYRRNPGAETVLVNYHFPW